jgi:hypothetical protein
MYLDPRCIVSRNVEPSKHPFLTLLRQNTPIAIPSKKVGQGDSLIGKTPLQLRVRVGFSILKVNRSRL